MEYGNVCRVVMTMVVVVIVMKMKAGRYAVYR